MASQIPAVVDEVPDFNPSVDVSSTVSDLSAAHLVEEEDMSTRDSAAPQGNNDSAAGISINAVAVGISDHSEKKQVGDNVTARSKDEIEQRAVGGAPGGGPKKQGTSGAAKNYTAAPSDGVVCVNSINLTVGGASGSARMKGKKSKSEPTPADAAVSPLVMKRGSGISAEERDNMVLTDNPLLKCTRLPEHYKLKKKLEPKFFVVATCHVPDGTRVVLHASNDLTPDGELENCVSIMFGGVAVFDDLRFNCRSGRGKLFDLKITLETPDPISGTYANAVKVTIDGPRKRKEDTGEEI